MVKHAFTFKIESSLAEDIRSLSKKRGITQNRLISELMELYKTENSLCVEMPKKYAFLFSTLYNKVIPFSFGLLTAYFYLRESWFFILFLIIALIPFFYQINAIDYKTLKVAN